MVDGVGAPEPTRPMRRTVVPVIAELLTNKTRQPSAPMIHRQSPEPVPPEPAHPFVPERERQHPVQRIFTEQKVRHGHASCLPVIAASNGKHHSLDQ